MTRGAGPYPFPTIPLPVRYFVALTAAVKRDLPEPVEPAVLTVEIARLTGRERRRAARG